MPMKRVALLATLMLAVTIVVVPMRALELQGGAARTAKTLWTGLKKLSKEFVWDVATDATGTVVANEIIKRLPGNTPNPQPRSGTDSRRRPSEPVPQSTPPGAEI